MAVFDPAVFDSEVFAAGTQLDRDEGVPVEWQTDRIQLDRDEAFPVEAVLGQQRDESIPVETEPPQQFVVPVFDVNVFDPDIFATGIQLDRDESISIDTAPGAVQLIRDEAIPIDISVAPVPPSEFVGFAGAGAPVWWLKAAPLLARSQHCGRIILTGRSRERWRQAVQRAMLVLLPIRRGRRPALPEPIIYQSQAILWTGGRSETRVFGMRQQIVRDDEEVMQLIMFIDSGA